MKFSSNRSRSRAVRRHLSSEEGSIQAVKSYLKDNVEIQPKGKTQYVGLFFP